MKKGEASGPQKRPRRVSVPDPAETREVAADGPLDPDAEVPRVEEGYQARAAWDATIARLSEEAQRVLTALEGAPAGDTIRRLKDMPLETLQQVEAKMTELRVVLEQTVDVTS